MRIVKEHIKARQQQYAQIEFFDWLQNKCSYEEIQPLLRKLGFFVMTFQEILRVNEPLIVSPELRKIARHHKSEDRGHDLWYFDDMIAMNGDVPDARELFAADADCVRDVAYGMMADVLRSTSDEERIALLLSLESTGHIVFDRVSDCWTRLECKLHLRYFSRSHLDVELSHDLFEQKSIASLNAIVLSEEKRATVIALVDRCFDAFVNMFTTLLKRARRGTSARL